MAKYNQYIKLRPGYESVVDGGSEERNPTLWQDYIVHEDMKVAIEKICESFKMEDSDKRRSFWIHGTYGTGKSYAAIVLKHLFTDTPENIEDFFDRKERITPFKKKFMSIRNNGDGEFLVVWNSGCSDIVTGTQLMMEMEMQIRVALEERFGDAAYFGQNSLVEETKRIVNDEDINWESLFQSSAYHMSDYGTLEDFRQEVMNGDKQACSTVAKICRDKGFAMFASVKNFKTWIADVIAGNALSEKGIVFIWDEFTDFVKRSGDDIVLQQLSEYCKQQPFYMFLIVHVDASWVSVMGEETYERIMHRYHELEFNITEAAAYEMIGETIVPHKGMEENWKSKRKELVRGIIGEFDEISYGLKESQMQSLCPIHPMTISLLTKVAGNFAASSRTLFRFMKDQGKADQNIGFLHFINTCGPDDWSWLTVDYLWDYFFTKDSDIRSFSAEARRAYQLFENKKELVEADDYTYRVFKGALLLIAIMSTDKATFSTYTKNNSRKIDATRNTLCRCFVGQLKSEKIDQCLQALHDSNILLLAETSNRKDARLELPYGKNVEKFDIRLDQTRKANTRYTLFKKNGEFSNAIEERLWSKTDATSPRMCIAACSSETNSMNQRHGELLVELKKFCYKIGIFAIIIPDGSYYATAQNKLQNYIEQDDTGRIVYFVLKEALTGDVLESWYRAKTNYDLANEDGKIASKQNAEEEMATARDTWAGSAADGQMMAIFAGKTYPSIYGKSDLINRVKKDVIFKIFEAAPERIVPTYTAFKKSNESAVKAGITLNAPNNAQIKNIEESFKIAKLMQINTIEDLEVATGTDSALAVSHLAGFVHSKMTQGAKIALDDLWIELQNRPFGHYNNMVSAYLMGFVLRFWVGSDFNWINSDSNPFPLTEQNLATMINNMCQDKVVNNTLSSGSQIWQDFKPYIKAVFELNDAEVANEPKARHSLSAKIISYGVPLWGLKYADTTSMGGEKVQEAYKGVLDTFCRFVQNNTGDNQEDVMATVVNLFNGKGKLRSILTKNLKDEALRYSSFKTFICMISEELDNLIHDLNINDTELFDCIKRRMQAQTDTWTEEQVNEKINDLSLEYKLVQALNKAISDEQKSIAAHVSTMRNCFSIMKVPGLVIEAMDGVNWIEALKKMYFLTNHTWQTLERQERENIVSIITVHGKAAWEHVQNQKVLLEKYLTKKKIAFNLEDVDRIYSEAQEWPYETRLPAFELSIERSVKAIKFEHNKVILLDRWKEISGFDTIEEWCNKNKLPIQWMVDSDENTFYTCIYSICKGKIVGELDLYNAIQFFKSGNFDFLKNHMLIREKFFAQIGKDKKQEFEEYEDDIMSQIRIKFGADVYSWSSHGGEISGLITNYLNKKAAVKVKNGARAMIGNMNEAELRERVLKAMDEVPMLYKFFV